MNSVQTLTQKQCTKSQYIAPCCNTISSTTQASFSVTIHSVYCDPIPQANLWSQYTVVYCNTILLEPNPCYCHNTTCCLAIQFPSQQASPITIHQVYCDTLSLLPNCNTLYHVVIQFPAHQASLYCNTIA